MESALRPGRRLSREPAIRNLCLLCRGIRLVDLPAEKEPNSIEKQGGAGRAIQTWRPSRSIVQCDVSTVRTFQRVTIVCPLGDMR